LLLRTAAMVALVLTPAIEADKMRLRSGRAHHDREWIMFRERAGECAMRHPKNNCARPQGRAQCSFREEADGVRPRARHETS